MNRAKNMSRGEGMSEEKVDVLNYSLAVSRVVWLKDRNFPGYVIQGDGLHDLYKTSREIQRLSMSLSERELCNLANHVVSVLTRMLVRYEEALSKENIALPYDPPVKSGLNL